MAGFKKGSIDFNNRSEHLVQGDVYQDHINLYAKDGRLYHIDDQGNTNLVAISGDVDLSAYATTSYVDGISGSLQYQIDNIDLSPYATTTLVYNISGDLQSQITSNDNDISLLQSNVTSLSGNLNNYTLLSTTASISASLVPYTGATSDVNLGNHQLTSDSIYLNNSNITSLPRQISWNEDDKTFNMGLTSEVTLQVGQEQLIRVYNGTNSNILNGQPVYITGITNDSPSVDLACASDIPSTAATKCIGIATEIISISGTGFITTSGKVRGIDTSLYTSGDTIYLGEVPGTFTNNISGFSYQSHINPIGFIGLVDAVEGTIYVSIKNESTILSLSERQSNIVLGNCISTGIYEFSGITQASSTSFTVPATKGWIVENTGIYATNPHVINVVYAGGTYSVTNIATQPATYVLIDRDNNIIQQANLPTPEERRTNIFLGKVVHNNLSTINTINNTVDYEASPFSALRDMFAPINILNTGVTIVPNGSNLSVNRNSGTLYGLGINWTANEKNPNSVTISGQTPLTFRSYVTRSSLISTNQTVIDPSNYDNSGVLTAVGGSSHACTNQRVYQFSNGNVIVQYGQTVYSNLASALAGIGTESYVPYTTTIGSAILIAYISVNKTATDLSDNTKVIITPAGLFGQPTGGTSNISTGTLQQAYDNSITPEIVINATLDGVTIKNGTGNDDSVTHILEGQNTAGIVTSYIMADGNGVFNGITVSAISGSSGSIVTHDASGKLLDSGILATSLATTSYVDGISGNLQSQVTSISGALGDYALKSGDNINAISFSTSIVTISGNYTSTVNDNTILCNGNLTLTLHSPASAYNSGFGQELNINNIGTQIINISGSIQSQVNPSIYTDEILNIISNGSGWYFKS